MVKWLKRIFVILYAWLYLVGQFLNRRPRVARYVYGGLTLLLLLVVGLLYLLPGPQQPARAASSRIGDLARVTLSLAPRATATPTVTPTPTPTPTPTVPPAAAACDTELQTRAMRRGHVPDWQSLALDACYDMTLDLSPASQSYTGTADVTFTNRTDAALTDLVFRTYPNAAHIYGGDLSVTAASVDDTPVSPETVLQDETAFRVALPQPLPPGTSTRVALHFNGQVPYNFGGFGTYGIFNFNDTSNVMTLANWYPILATRRDGEWRADAVIRAGDAVVSDVALYRVRVSAPTGWQLITTGTQVTPTQESSSPPVFVSGPVREFTVVAGTAFEPSSTGVGEVRLVHWGLPDGQFAWDDVLTVAREAFATYEDRFGPYPYAELDVAAVPLRTIMGMEYPGLSLIDADIYAGAQRPFLPIMTAHEVAHQWWYGVVGNDAISAPWQDEGLTEFSALLYFEEHRPSQYASLLQTYEQNVAGYRQIAGDEPLAQSTEAFVGRRQNYETIAYYKGLLFFRELHEQLGDAQFFAALQSYYNRNRYGLTSPDDLLDAFEATCGCDLSTTYAEWGVR